MFSEGVGSFENPPNRIEYIISLSVVCSFSLETGKNEVMQFIPLVLGSALIPPPEALVLKNRLHPNSKAHLCMRVQQSPPDIHDPRSVCLAYFFAVRPIIQAGIFFLFQQCLSRPVSLCRFHKTPRYTITPPEKKKEFRFWRFLVPLNLSAHTTTTVARSPLLLLLLSTKGVQSEPECGCKCEHDKRFFWQDEGVHLLKNQGEEKIREIRILWERANGILLGRSLILLFRQYFSVGNAF